LLQSFEGLATAPDAIAADDVPEVAAVPDDSSDDDDERDEAASAVS
jgi:hypothetical protein